MKKRTLIVVALAIVLALSFATIATAKYAGYAYNNPYVNASGETTVNPLPGYLSWNGALKLNSVNLNGKAHGGYVSTTVKCAVCHSTHRAVSPSASSGALNFADSTPAGARNNFLTASDGTCANCHSNFGAGGSSRKIEWAETGSGPHSNFGCVMQCHGGGVHGGNASDYHGNNVYMLGNGEAEYNGANIGNSKDAMLAFAFANGNILRDTGASNAAVTTAQTWFETGTTGPVDAGAKPAGLTNGQFAQAKGTATGYTCAQGGCHDSSQFAVNSWGYSEMRRGKPGGATSVANPMGDTAFTGHRTSPGHGNSERTGALCGPCHPGNAAGGYRTATPATNALARQYGCDQCHDMVGKATNSTAWPHANRSITVYQWNTAGARTERANNPSGNLWMYAGSIASTDTTGDNGAAAADKSFAVIDGSASFASTSTATPGKILDGACLKCHVAVDADSLAANGGAAGAPHHTNSGPTTDPVVVGQDANSSRFVFLWK